MRCTLLLLAACTSKAPPDSGGDTADTASDSGADTDTGSTDTDTDTGADSGDTDTGTDTDTGGDTDTGTTPTCVPAGIYGDPNWSLEVAQDCSALLKGFCGDGSIVALPMSEAGAFSVSLTWDWQGAGPSGGEDPATFVGTVAAGVVDGTLSWGSTADTVHAELGVTPGTGLGLDSCPLD